MLVPVLPVQQNKPHVQPASSTNTYKHLFKTSPIQNVLKRDALSFFNFTLQYTFRKAKENQEEMGLAGIYQLLVCADNFTLKLKVELSLCLTMYHAMNPYGEVEV
jgi:hypothetical protein